MAAATHDWWLAVDEWVDAYPGAQAEVGQVYEWLCDAPERAAVAVPHHTRGPKVYERRDGAWFDHAWGVMVAARDIAAAHEPGAVRALRPHAGDAWIGCVACPFIEPPTADAQAPSLPRVGRGALRASAAMADPIARAGIPAVRLGEGAASAMYDRGWRW